MAESAPVDLANDAVPTDTPKPVNQTIAQLRSFFAGGVGGVCAVIVGHPFDLVKVRLQTAEKGVYAGAIDCVKKTIAREGLAKVSPRVVAGDGGKGPVIDDMFRDCMPVFRLLSWG